MKHLFNYKYLFLLIVVTLIIAVGCANEELTPPTEPVEATPESILQPAEEPTENPDAVEPAEESQSPGEAYPEPETVDAAPSSDDPYPADVETADVAPADEELDSYPAPDESSEQSESAEEEPPLRGGVETFVVQPEASSAQYSVDEEFFNRDIQFVTAIGVTNDIEGAISVDLSGDVPVVREGFFTVDLSTLTSDSNRRDEAIRNDWLESSLFPDAIFVARELATFPDSYVPGEQVEFELIGDLTIREVTQEVTWTVTAQLQDRTLTATAEAFVFMADFGFEPPSVLGILEVTDGVEVTVDLTAAAP